MHRSRYAYGVPALILLGLLSIYPMFQLLRMALSDVSIGNLSGGWNFTGWDNLHAITSDPQFAQILLNTVMFVGIVTVIGVVGGFLAALLVNDHHRSSNYLLALMVFVWALPPIVNGSVWKFLLSTDGMVNALLQSSHVMTGPAPFLFNQKLALFSVALVNSWAVVPFNALVFRAAFFAVPVETIEASKIDGANAWQEIRHILIPAVRPTALVLGVLTLVYGFRSFDFIYVMTYGGPGTATNTLPFLGYLKAFVLFQFGRGAAIAVVSVLFTSILAVLYARSVRKEEEID